MHLVVVLSIYPLLCLRGASWPSGICLARCKYSWLTVFERSPCSTFVFAMQDGLSGKTPLHYVIEKKDPDFVGWFLGLVSFMSDKNGTNMQEIVNAYTNSQATALRIACDLQNTDDAKRVRIIQLLVQNGADPSPKFDSTLRRDLCRIPQVCFSL
jgi:hypothetical protein